MVDIKNNPLPQGQVNIKGVFHTDLAQNHKEKINVDSLFDGDSSSKNWIINQGEFVFSKKNDQGRKSSDNIKVLSILNGSGKKNTSPQQWFDKYIFVGIAQATMTPPYAFNPYNKNDNFSGAIMVEGAVKLINNGNFEICIGDKILLELPSPSLNKKTERILPIVIPEKFYYGRYFLESAILSNLQEEHSFTNDLLDKMYTFIFNLPRDYPNYSNKTVDDLVESTKTILKDTSLPKHKQFLESFNDIIKTFIGFNEYTRQRTIGIAKENARKGDSFLLLLKNE